MKRTVYHLDNVLQLVEIYVDDVFDLAEEDYAKVKIEMNVRHLNVKNEIIV
jgi:hypothetical protein